MKKFLSKFIKLLFNPFFDKPWINLTPIGKFLFLPLQIPYFVLWVTMIILLIAGAIMCVPIFFLCGFIDTQMIEPTINAFVKSIFFIILKKIFIKSA